MVPVSNGEGRPDLTLVEEALRINRRAENQRVHSLLLETVHTALDAVIGFDFQIPQAANRLQCEQPASDLGAIQPTRAGAERRRPAG